jgi:hypothetical protein
LKRPLIKLTETPVELIFDRTILKRKEKKYLKRISSHISCLSNGVFNQLAHAFSFAFDFFLISIILDQ